MRAEEMSLEFYNKEITEYSQECEQVGNRDHGKQRTLETCKTFPLKNFGRKGDRAARESKNSRNDRFCVVRHTVFHFVLGPEENRM